MFSNFLLELYWIKSLDHKSLFIACGYFSDRHEYLVILVKMFFVLMTRPKLCNTAQNNNATLFIIISILLRLGKRSNWLLGLADLLHAPKLWPLVKAVFFLSAANFYPVSEVALTSYDVIYPFFRSIRMMSCPKLSALQQP